MDKPENESRGLAMLRCMADLHAAGVDITLQRMRRESPAATPEEIQRKVRAWLGHDGVLDLVDRDLAVPLTSRFRHHA